MHQLNLAIRAIRLLCYLGGSLSGQCTISKIILPLIFSHDKSIIPLQAVDDKNVESIKTNGLSISKDIGQFKESFAEENDIEMDFPSPDSPTETEGKTLTLPFEDNPTDLISSQETESEDIESVQIEPEKEEGISRLSSPEAVDDDNVKCLENDV